LRMPAIKGSNRLDSTVAPHAPCFYPTLEEFEDPFTYISSIRPIAEPYGICRVRPPCGWKPPFAIDSSSFKFKTRIQNIDELFRKRRKQPGTEWHKSYDSFMTETGKRWKKNPVLSGSEIDLYSLHCAVGKRGGYETVTEKRLWREVAKAVEMSEITTNTAYNLRMLYHQKLLPYDEWVTRGNGEGNGALAGETAMELDSNLASAVKPEKGTPVQADISSCPPKKRVKLEASSTKMTEPEGQAQQAPLPVPPRAENRVPDNIDTLLCEACGGGHHEDKIILCDKCDLGFHMFCLSPPLEEVPEGDWICPICNAKVSEKFCFKEGREYTLKEFEAFAMEFEKTYTQGLADRLGKNRDELVWQDFEEDFWRVIDCGDDPVEVIYGADLDTTVSGSGFPLDPHSSDATVAEYSKHPWNINNFPQTSGRLPSLLEHIDEKIPGVMVPWMYIGMLYSTFCWHVEDHMFYSINYMHWGDPKRWYGIPAFATPEFEAAFKTWLPERFAIQPDLLFHLVTMISPYKLMESGVPVYGVVQEPGDFVITFPSAYHAGFNTGFNCAEAVNFVPPDWLRFGSVSQERYRHYRRQPVLSLEDLVLKLSRKESLSPEAAAWVAMEMERVAKDEKDLRVATWAKGITQSILVDKPAGMVEGQHEDPECCVCHAILNFSAVQCTNPKCDAKRLVCLHHADQLCECEHRKHQLLFRHTCKDLDVAVSEVRALALRARKTPDWRPLRKKSSWGFGRTLTLEGTEDEDPVISEEDKDAPPPLDVELPPRHPNGDLPTVSPGDGLRRSGNQDSGSGPPALTNGDGPSSYCGEAASPRVDGDQGHRDMVVPGGPQRGPPDRAGMVPTEDELSHPAGATGMLEAAQQTQKPEQSEAVDDGGAHGAGSTAHASGNRPRQSPPDKRCEDPRAASEVAVALEAKGSRVTVVIGAKRLRPEPEPEGHADHAVCQTAMRAVPCYPKLEKVLARREQMLRIYTAAPEVEVDQSAEAGLRESYEEWRSCAKEMLAKGRCKLTDLKDMIHRGAAFLWGGDYAQEAKELRDALEDARSWGKTCQALGATKSPIEELERVVFRDPMPAQIWGVKKMRDAVVAAREIQPRLDAMLRRIGDSSAAPVPFAELEQLVTDALSNPAVEMPAARKLQVHLSKINLWTDRVRQLMPVATAERMENRTAATMDQLRSLQAEVKDMRIQIPLASELSDACGKMSGWQREAREALQMKQPIGRLEELLAAAQDNPVLLVEAKNIQEVLDKARSWKEGVEEALASGAEMKTMRELLHAGERLAVRLPDVEELRKNARRREWEQAAEKVLLGSKASLVQISDLLRDAAAMNAADSAAAAKLREHFDTTTAIDSKLVGFASRLEQGDQTLRLSEVEETIEAAANLRVKLESAARCQALISGCKEWSGRAQAILDRKSDGERPAASAIDDLLLEAEKLPITMDLVGELKKVKECISQWSSKAASLLAAGGSGSADAAVQHLKAAEDLGVSLPEEDSLRRVVEASEWNTRVAVAMKDAGQGAELNQARQWVKDAHGLPVDDGILSTLTGAIDSATKWGERMSASLCSGRLDGRLTGSQLAAALEEVKRFLVKPPAGAMAKVESAVRDISRWEERAKALIAKAEREGRRLTLRELDDVVERGIDSSVSSPLLQELNDLLAAAEDWEAGLVQCLNKRLNSNAKVDDMLSMLGVSVSALLARAELNLPPSAIDRAKSGRGNLSKWEPKSMKLPKGLTCICMEEDQGNGAWVCCDFCGDWYHLKCQGITAASAKAMKKFSCSICTATKPGATSDDDVFDPSQLARMRRTRAPAIASLRSHLDAALKLRVEPRAEAKLGVVLATYEVATAAISECLNAHIAACSAEQATRGNPFVLEETVLRNLLKAAMACEIESLDLAKKALRAIRLLKWRARADSLLASKASSPSMDAVSKMAKEGTALGCSATSDWPLRELAGRVQQAKEWSDRARKAIAAGSSEVSALLAEGEQLRQRVRLGKLMEDLKEALTPYCYCRQQYNPDRAMVACDECNEWYHFDCVGLPTMGESEMAPAEFRCPSCCLKAGASVNLAELPPETQGALRELLPAAQPSQRPPAEVAAPAPEALPQQPLPISLPLGGIAPAKEATEAPAASAPLGLPVAGAPKPPAPAQLSAPSSEADALMLEVLADPTEAPTTALRTDPLLAGSSAAPEDAGPEHPCQQMPMDISSGGVWDADPGCLYPAGAGPGTEGPSQADHT